MGNCLRHESPLQWGGDDWGSPVPERFLGKEEKGMLINMKEEALSLSSSATTTENISETTSHSIEVKIKITKKQLEELLGRVDMKQLSVEQVLAQLIKVGGDEFESQQRSWRPNLQSIPE